MKRLPKRNVTIGKRRTSITIEDVFWNALREIARRRRRPLHRILQDIAMTADEGLGLSSAIRVFVFQHFYDVAHGAA